MTTVNVHQAKTHLSRLLLRVAAGEDVVIAKAGKPMARLVRYDKTRRRRVPGRHKDQGWIAEDFDAPMPASFMKYFK